MESDVKFYYATPISRINTGEIALADELFEFILNQKVTNPNRDKTPQSAHPDLYESQFDFLKWQVPVVQKLKELMYNRLSHFINQTSGFGSDELAKLEIFHDSWFHIVKNGGYFQMHNHPLASWSMIFCVSPGDTEPENDYSAGKVLFLDPRVNAAMFMDPTNRDMIRDLSFNGIKIRPEKADLIIFPSYLLHSVEPYIGQRERITVAANFWFQYRQ